MKHLIYFLTVCVFLLLSSCLDDKEDFKPASITSNTRFNSLMDTTITAYSYGDVSDIIFDSLFVVESITVYYNEIPRRNYFGTQRMFIVELIDTLNTSILNDSLLSVELNNIYERDLIHLCYQDQTIIFNNLNKRCSKINVYGQPDTGKRFEFTIHGHYSNINDNEVISVFIDDENPSIELGLDSSYVIKSIKAQHYGLLNKSYSITSNNLSINISDVSSVHNINNYTPNIAVNSLTFTMTPNSGFSYNYGYFLFTVVVEK